MTNISVHNIASGLFRIVSTCPHHAYFFVCVFQPTFILKKRIEMVMRADELTFAEVELGAILTREKIVPIRQAMSCFTVYVYGIV